MPALDRSPASGRGVNVVWFKRDLRIVDHRPLAMAAKAGSVLPLYIAEPVLWAQPDSSARQWEFVAECLEELRAALLAHGASLCVMVGDPVAIFRRLHDSQGVAAVWSHEETGNDFTYARDRAMAAWAKETGVPWHESQQFGVVRRLKSRNGWAKLWDARMAEPLTLPPDVIPVVGGDWPTDIPTSAELGLAADPCPYRQPGGRAAARATLASFLQDRGRDYRSQMSSPLTAFEASSRLSPHLTWGTLSMREVAHASRERMRALRNSTDPAATAWRASMISFTGRQHWHCHFMQKLEDEPRIEFDNFHRAYDGMRPASADADRLARWSDGTTGFPFIDACMRALNQHGWINFRMRAMLMSFASYHLWLPWRESGLHLARKFVDYEPGIHWSQVQMQSGTTGINTLRIYNPVKQGYDQDPQGMFVRAYVPELDAVPAVHIHEPWHWSGARLLSYPAPLVAHEAAAKAARDALHAIRKSAAHNVEAREVAAKHGSRKSGIPMTGKQRSAKVVAPGDVQLAWDF